MSLINKIKKELNRVFIARMLYTFLVTLRNEGFIASIMSLGRSFRVQRMAVVKPEDYTLLDLILKENLNKPIVVFHPYIDWNIPLFQRPQHIALNLSKDGFLYFFCTKNSQYDSIKGFKPHGDSIYLTNRYKMLNNLGNKRILHLCSTDNHTDVETIDNELNKGNIILYEYIDEIHGSLGGIDIPEKTFIKHTSILKDERCIVIATADKLFRDVLKYRSRNCALVQRLPVSYS